MIVTRTVFAKMGYATVIKDIAEFYASEKFVKTIVIKMDIVWKAFAIANQVIEEIYATKNIVMKVAIKMDSVMIN